MTEKNLKIIDDTFIVHKTLGKGLTSKVVLAEHIETGYKLAIKMFKPLKQMKLMLEAFRKEVDGMKNLKNENLINIIAANENGIYVRPDRPKENIMYLGLELAENAELFDFISDPGRGFSEEMSRILFKQLISGLESMHKIGICHRDIKTENLFLDSEFNLKVGDFGFAKFMDPNVNHGKLKTQLGTSGYQCPELLEGTGYNGDANDIFACGVVLFILVNAYPPFREAKKTDNWYRNIYFEKYENFWAQHSKKTNMSSDLKELITGCLKFKNRWTMKDILESKWLNGKDASKTTYLADMEERKVLVDERRNREKEEKLKNEGHSNDGVYRGSDDEQTEKLKSLLDELQINEDNFPVRSWAQDRSTKYSLRYEGTDLKSNFKSFISTIVSNFGEVTLDPENYDLSAEIKNVTEEEDSETGEKCEISSTLGFSASLFADYSSKETVVELIKDGGSDPFEFKSFVSKFGKN